jgi:2-keto-4-pentenoate hydratase/2-oxohepta-3-ene-1,7-dioic acid hydratase in catechol pathway
MRLATIRTPRGPRLHVAVPGGYLDVAEATGDPGLADAGSMLRAGQRGADAIRQLSGRDGRPVRESDFGPAVPEPSRVLCLGVNYTEHAIEGGRAVPTWPEVFVRGPGSLAGPYDELVVPR